MIASASASTLAPEGIFSFWTTASGLSTASASSTSAGGGAAARAAASGAFAVALTSWAAVPGVFSTVPLLVREPDGSIQTERSGRPNVGAHEQSQPRDAAMRDALTTPRDRPRPQRRPSFAFASGLEAARDDPDAQQACYFDGSMEADLPMTLVCEMFNINHFIISPHHTNFIAPPASGCFSMKTNFDRLFGLLHRSHRQATSNFQL